MNIVSTQPWINRILCNMKNSSCSHPYFSILLDMVSYLTSCSPLDQLQIIQNCSTVQWTSLDKENIYNYTNCCHCPKLGLVIVVQCITLQVRLPWFHIAKRFSWNICTQFGGLEIRIKIVSAIRNMYTYLRGRTLYDKSLSVVSLWQGINCDCWL